MKNASVRSNVSAPPRRRGLVYNLCKYWQLYLFLLIPVAYILIFHYYPMLGLQLAFKRFNIRLGMWGSPWIGLKNFTKFFKSYQFGRILPNTLLISFYSLSVNFFVAIVFALALNAMRKKRLQKVIQNISYIPHFISTVVMVGMMLQMLNPRLGLYGNIVTALTGAEPSDLFAIPGAFRHLYVWSGVWQNTGWNSIIYVAALSSVPPELHEAAQIDGASRLKRIVHVDLPAILPTATILLIMNAGNILSVGFEKVYLMQNSVNLSTSEVISTYVYKVAMTAGTGDFGYSTAIGMFNSVVNLVLLVIVNTIAGKVSSTSLW